ncbi:endonuclease MutS2 [Fusobacterium sp. MFO224]|uniref:endonuclease MutS2 n=1 Tax=Fusobacterium sp. MFO224 TaxID=3378070 RepID=UPI00385226BE
MNTHSYNVLEFNKLKNVLSEYMITETSKSRAKNLSIYKEVNLLRKEFSVLKDFIDFCKYDGGVEISGINDITTLLKKCDLIGMFFEPDELFFINQNLRIFRLFKNKLEELDKYKELRNKFSPIETLKKIEDIINKTIDNEKNIKDEASLDLRDLRAHKKLLSSNIKRKFEDMFSNDNLSKAIQEKIITVRDGRNVIPVKTDFKGLIKGIEHDRSSSGQTVFIEPLAVVSLNNKMRELEAREREEIRKILLRLTDQIRVNIDIIFKISEACLELDFLNGKSRFSIDLKCNIPEINTREQLNIIKGRHPFIPKDQVVPLTFEIGKKYNTLLITGPNTGGKTVALKVAGLLTLMALSGVPIPASEDSSVGFFENVYADIGDEQSIEQSLSSFSAHLTNVQKILSDVSKNSLVLLDELGSGTDPVEGSAFAMAVIDYLKDKKAKSIITTHYSEVKAYGYNEEQIETASMEFNSETLSPTYKLLIGIPGESNALTIAKRLGVLEEVINKAESYISDENKKVEKMISNIKTKSEELEVMQVEVDRLKRKALADKQEYEEKLRKLEIEKNKILKEAYEKADNMMKEMQNKAAALVKKIQSEETKKLDAKNVQKSLNMLRSSLKDDKNKNVETKPKTARKIDIREGEKVFVKSLKQYADVLKINKVKETVFIQAGILKLEVSLDDVSKIITKKKKTYTSIASHNKSAVKSKIDLRGKMVEESVYDLESYFDSAMLSGYKEVQVITGNGTGALRKGVISYLKECRYVKEFRFGGQGEGGVGCIVVTLK